MTDAVARTDRTRRMPSPGARRTAVLAGAATFAMTATAAGAQRDGGVGEPVGGGSGGAKPTVEAASSGVSAGLVIGVVAAALVIVVVLVIVAVVVGRSRRSGPPPVAANPQPAAGPGAAPGYAAPSSPPPAVDPRLQQAAGERARLVQVLIELGDQLDSVALRGWVAQALQEVGVAQSIPDGERFDPARHQAVDQVATADPATDGTVAQTIRAGYADRGQVLRLPQVVVARIGAS